MKIELIRSMIVGAAAMLFLTVLEVDISAQPKAPKKAISVSKTELLAPMSAQDIAESGSFDGKVYVNDLLKFSLATPQGWEIAGDDMNRAMLSEGNEKLKTNETRTMQKAFDKSIANTKILFHSTPLPLGTPGNTASFACGIEKVIPGTTAQVYAEFNKKLVVEKASNARVVKPAYTLNVGGMNFTVFDIKASAGNVAYGQKYLISMRRDVAFFFVLTFLDETYEETMMASLKSLRFGK